MATPLPTTHRVKAADGRVAADFLLELDASDRTLLLTRPTNTSIRTARRLLKFSAGVGVGADRVLVVAQGFTGVATLGIRELGELLQREIYWELVAAEAPPHEQTGCYQGLAAKLGLDRRSVLTART
ncbi:MAG: hypothetical protein ACT4R6_06005 [Gemmatimonadaceae bacterium]